MTRVRSRFDLLVALLTVRHDRRTESGRSMSRYRAIAITFMASFLAKGIGIAVTLVSVPLTLGYLGTERFGMWMVLSSFALLVSLTDLGVGNSVLTAVAKTSGHKDTSQVRRQIASAYAVTGAIAAALLVVLVAIYGFVPWPLLFNVSGTQAMAEAGPASAVFFAIIAVATPLNLINRIQLGLQQGFRSSLWQAAGGVMALGAIYLATWLEASLPWLVAAQSGVPVVVALVNAVHFFRWTRPDLRPAPRHCDREAIRGLWGGGLLFLVLQVCAAVMFQSNMIVVAQVMNAEAVAILVPFSVLLGFAVWKVMEAIGNAVSMLLNGLNEIQTQAILAVFNAAANLALKIWLVGELGLPGVMLATILAYSIFALPWMIWLVRSAILRMGEQP